MKNLQSKKNENAQRRARQGRRQRSLEDFDKILIKKLFLLIFCTTADIAAFRAYRMGRSVLLPAQNIKLKGGINNS
jgi:hypothetical protein